MTVYFAQAGVSGPVKIGTCADGRLKKRLWTIQCYNHEKIELINTVDGDHDTERLFHLQFENKKIRGEWFDYCPTMKDVKKPDKLIYDDSSKSGLECATRVVGGSNALGRLLGITGQAVASWSRVPAERAAQVEEITGVPRHRLRPDLWGRKVSKTA